jgi:hypothetical protein
MHKRRRSSEESNADSDDSEQYPITPAIRKRKKLDPVNIFSQFIVVVYIFSYSSYSSYFRWNNVRVYTK